MSLELDAQKEPKDRTKLLWLGVGALVLIMIALLSLYGRPDPNTSMVRAKHILIQCNQNDPTDRARALELATSIRERLANGENFRSLAREYSNDPGSAARGGDLGYYPKGSFAPEFEQYVWNAPVNELSEIVSTTHGFHLIIVLDRHVTEADKYEMELDKRAREALDKEKADQTTKPAP